MKNNNKQVREIPLTNTKRPRFDTQLDKVFTEEEKEFLEAITKIGDEKTKNIILTYISNKKEEYKQKVKEIVTAYLCKYSCRPSEKIRLAKEWILNELRRE